MSADPAAARLGSYGAMTKAQFDGEFQMIRTRFLALATAAGFALSAAALAQQAQTMRTANVRAGPAAEFPLVATLAPGTPVNVDGCVADYAWCDVDFGGGRGWVRAASLQSYYQNRVVPLYGYGASIGLPIITFSLNDYWGRHYRGRPFYRDYGRWEQRWHANNDYRRYEHAQPRGDYRPRADYRQPQREYVQPRADYRRDYNQSNQPRTEYRHDNVTQPRVQAVPPRADARTENIIRQQREANRSPSNQFDGARLQRPDPARTRPDENTTHQGGN
jgi:uncharacterized protein YraI